MSSIIQLSPILLTFTMLLLLRRPPVQAAMAGAIAVALLWVFGFGVPLEAALASAVARDTGVLFASTAAVIAPALAFVILIERAGVNKAMAAFVQGLGWSRAGQVVFIVLGLAPLIESMTGFGVSLIATVPLLLALFDRAAALRIALSGMVIMPWGTLGLATVIGAALASMPAATLGQASALVSAPVFLAMGGLALWLGGVRHLSAWALLCVSWALFVAVLYAATGLLGPEVAGVAAGLTILGIGLASARRRGPIPAWPRAAWPYFALLLAIVAIKGVLLLGDLEQALVVTGAAVSWRPLASPGLALAIVLALMLARGTGLAARIDAGRHEKTGTRLAREFGADWVRRSWKPLATIFFFLLMSQALLKGGFLDGFQSGLAQLSSATLAPIAAALAGLSGYLTGSNVGGNAIFMPALAGLPVPEAGWLAAIQNSGAGHAALGSLSILALITGLAQADRIEEAGLVRFGFAVALVNTILVGATGTVLIETGLAPPTR